jgi:hypothetical protein
LLGKKHLATSDFPPMVTVPVPGEIAFRQHTGGHTTGPNGPTFLIFASRYLRAVNEKRVLNPNEYSALADDLSGKVRSKKSNGRPKSPASLELNW